MSFGTSALFNVSLLLTVPLALSSVAYAQEPKPAATPAPAPDFATQEEMTGEWGGTRSAWKEKGVELEFKFYQFAQGVASGGIDTGAVGNSKFQTAFEFDFGKLAGWNFWLAEIRTETRFGGPLLGGTGAINPVNTTAIIPTASGSSFTISAANVTKLFPINLKKGDLFAVSSGSAPGGLLCRRWY